MDRPLEVDDAGDAFPVEQEVAQVVVAVDEGRDGHGGEDVPRCVESRDDLREVRFVEHARPAALRDVVVSQTGHRREPRRVLR